MTVLSEQQPYPGLRPFERADAPFFFGRETQTRALRRKLDLSRLVAVVGRSGCGKSSLVRAGLIPLLERESGGPWHVILFRPQGEPIAELTKELFKLGARLELEAAEEPAREVADIGPGEIGFALRPAQRASLLRSQLDATLRRSSQGLVEAVAELNLPESSRLLIVVDQFEEIFRFEGERDSDTNEATAFVRLLIEAINADAQIRVILTMRLDFLGDCARFQRLPEAMSDGQFLVPNLSRAERRAAIEAPARKCGSTVSPAVTQRLLNEVGEDPDQLPVLQHVLMRMWKEASGSREITLQHYGKTGGFKNAISRHATQVFERLPSAQHQLAAERIFKAISELDRRGRALRRAQELGDIIEVVGEPEDIVIDVIETFRAPDCCFLMPPASEELTKSRRIDISHESLLRGWTKMTGVLPEPGWLAEESQNGKNYRSLLDDAEKFARDPTRVLSPAETRELQTWWKAVAPNSAWAKRYGGGFDLVQPLLDASQRQLEESERQQRENERQRAENAQVAEREQKLRRQRRVLIFGVGGLAVILMIIGLSWYEVYTTNKQLTAALKQTDQERTKRDREAQAATSDARAARAEIDKLKLEASDLEAENSVLGKEIEELKKLLGQSIRPPDPVPVDPPPTTPAANQDGFMWIGSARSGLLLGRDGKTVALPGGVVTGGTYQVEYNFNLRERLPDRNYKQGTIIGTVPAGSFIEARGEPVGYVRSTGTQYWIPIRLASRIVALAPTVYFQFAAGTRTQAQNVSKALQDKGYTIPGEERNALAAGIREVRYFYPQDRDAATKLEKDTNEVLQKLGYAASPAVALKDFTNFQGTKNPLGVLEVWLDLPARSE